MLVAQQIEVQVFSFLGTCGILGLSVGLCFWSDGTPNSRSLVRRTARKQKSLQRIGSIWVLFGSNSAGTGQNKSCIVFLQQTNFSRVTLESKWTAGVGIRTRDSPLGDLESNPRFPQGPNEPLRLVVGGGGMEVKAILQSMPKQERDP